MGLIKAGMGALGGTLADQWKEFFYCDSLDKDVLMVKGQKRTSRRSSNNGEDNIITNGSGIAVADGQCMLIVEQGRVVEVCAEPGEFTFDASTEPSVFTGNFGDSLAETFQTVAKRFTYGGDTGKDQRVYYINTKELGEILYGTATPIPFRVVVSEERGYKLSVNLRCNGSFTCRICDPLLFYTNVCSNVSTQYDASEIAPRLKSELMNALQPALATLSANKVQYYEIPAHTLEISEALNEQLSNVWRKKRGIEVFSFNINSLSIPEEQQKKITEWEENAMTTDPTTAAARLVGGQIDAMKTAAGNTAGAMTGFMGMGMAAGAGGMGGMSAQNLFAMGQQARPDSVDAPQQVSRPAPAPADSWQCSCGATVTGKFCPECGSKKPEPKPGWTCSCGAVNKGRFCSECGKPKPAGTPKYKCDKCGWEPEDPAHPPKFCPECGTLHRSKLRDGQFLCDDCGNKCSKYIRLSELTLDEAKEHMEYMARMKRVFDEVFDKTEFRVNAYPSTPTQMGLVFCDELGMLYIDDRTGGRGKMPELIRYDQIASYEEYLDETPAKEPGQKPTLNGGGLKLKLVQPRSITEAQTQRGMHPHPYIKQELVICFSKRDRREIGYAHIARQHLDHIFGVHDNETSMFGRRMSKAEERELKGQMGMIGAMGAVASAAMKGGQLSEQEKARFVENINLANDAQTGGMALYSRRADEAFAKVQ